MFEVFVSGGISVLRWLSELITNYRSLSMEERRRYYDDHIKPIYEKMEIVHQDYESSFSEAEKMLHDGRRVARFLGERRWIYQHVRQDARNLAEELRKPQKRRADDGIQEALYEFAESIQGYFEPPLTKYEREGTPYHSTIRRLMEVNDARFTDGLLRLINEDLPASWDRVSKAHAKIRSLLLK